MPTAHILLSRLGPLLAEEHYNKTHDAFYMCVARNPSPVAPPAHRMRSKEAYRAGLQVGLLREREAGEE